MAIKIIDSFDIAVKAFNKDYYSRIYRINTPYKLKAGDRLYRVHYENRGIIWDDVKILSVTEDEITIGEYWLHKDKVFTLKFNQEPNYNKIFKKSININPEQRQLIIRPFPIFREKPNFKRPKKWTLEDFYTEENERINSIIVINFKEYLRNFENLVDVQISLF